MSLYPSDPKFQIQKFIDLQGYVMYPGPYPIRYEGEKLADVISRAGGLRPGAYLEASRFYRRGAIGDKILVGQIPIDFRQALENRIPGITSFSTREIRSTFHILRM